MEIIHRNSSPPFTTKDGSTIRSLLDRTNSSAANQSLAEATVPPGGATEPHRHPKTEEIYYILSGTGRIQVRSRCQVFSFKLSRSPSSARAWRRGLSE